MPKTYRFGEEQIRELECAKKKNKNKRVDKRLEALLLRAAGVKRSEVSEKTKFCEQYITDLTSDYQRNGISAIVESQYGGNHRNLSFEEEAELLAPFKEAAAHGQIVSISEILAAYEAKIGRSTQKDHGRIYRVLAQIGRAHV